MVHMLRLWLRNRRREVGAVAIVLLALVVVALVAGGGAGFGLTVLGNPAAPRASALADGSEVLPRSSDSHTQPGALPEDLASLLDTPAQAGTGPQDVATAQATWGATETAQHQRAVLDAVNCARHRRRQPPLVLDPALSHVAADAWLKLTRDRGFSLAQLPGRYTGRGVLALDFSAPDIAEQVAAPGQGGQRAPACQIGGLDSAALPADGPTATRVGVAVFPPQADWDSASAVVLVQ